MRRNLAKSIGHATRKHPLFSSDYTSSAGGRGRGRGSLLSSSDLGNSQPAVSTSRQTDDNDDSKDEPPASSQPPTMGHGRGKPFISSQPSLTVPPSSTTNRNPNPNSTLGSGRGRGSLLEPRQHEQQRESSGPKKPIFFLKEDGDSSPKSPIEPERGSSSLPPGILDVLMSGGAGRGKPSTPPTAARKEENRHLRQRPTSRRGSGTGTGTESGEPLAAGGGGMQLSPEDARKKAMRVLSKGDSVFGEEDGKERGERRGFGGGGSVTRGGRGGRFSRGRGRGRGGRGRFRQQDDEEDGDLESALYLGEDADGERFAERIGPENNNLLTEAFEEMSSTVLPSPLDDAIIEAQDLNYKIECEPEYLMEEFGTNPDIDEKPPIPLRDALEKMKPFLMAYEGIQSQEEWEEVMKETMAQVPLMKEIVDYYSGPDRVTAKVQNEELQRVANTLPQSIPPSVKTFTDRTLLSLQSNPGWGFDKKCQFMDKMVWEVSHQYK